MSNAVPFTINPPHTTAISPTSGSTGTIVTINGSGFGGGTSCGGGDGGGGGSASASLRPQAFGVLANAASIPQNSSVMIGGADASTTSWCDTKIVVTVSSLAVTGVVKVDADGDGAMPPRLPFPMAVRPLLSCPI